MATKQVKKRASQGGEGRKGSVYNRLVELAKGNGGVTVKVIKRVLAAKKLKASGVPVYASYLRKAGLLAKEEEKA